MTRTALLAALAMTMLAANSLLTRAGVLDGTDPLAFAAIRVGAGAVVLALLVRGRVPVAVSRLGAAAALVVYLLGFSLAYRTLDAGLGALILFGTVQVALLGTGLVLGERFGALRWAGMAVASLGLGWLLWPDDAAGAPVDVALMVAAGLGWAAYTYAGRGEPSPLGATAANFVLGTGLMALTLPLWWGAPVTSVGAVWAVASGAVTSGLGYALLYRVLPRMGVAAAGVMQLSAPVIAVVGGAVLLGEAVTPRMLGAGALVLAGIGLAVSGAVQGTIRSKGS